MPKEILTAAKVKSSKPGTKLCDGGGLWLRTDKDNNRYWYFRYTRLNKRPELGIGQFPDVSLAEARNIATEQRDLLRQGIDPISHRKKLNIQDANQAATFKQCAEEYLAIKQAEWKKGGKSKAQWESSLKEYAYPTIGGIAVNEVETYHILAILEPLWSELNVTATRVRQRVENILDYATTKNRRTGTNPARWKGHLDSILPKPSNVAQVKHHAALPWKEAPAFFAKLLTHQSTSAIALQVAILTALRTTENIKAEVSEFDLSDDITWNVPKERMKKKRPHRVPLSHQLVAIIKHQAGRTIKDNRHLFPGLIKGKPIGNMAMLKFLQKDMGYSELTVHGFRSTFKDWAVENNQGVEELSEACLAHALKNKVQAAYQRGDLLERRRELMQAWADYLFSLHKDS